MSDKVICTERRCYWQGTTDDMLKAPSPFDSDDELQGCPKCKCVNTLVLACDVDGCWKETSCGFPTLDGGYRRTCGDHYRAYKEEHGEQV